MSGSRLGRNRVGRLAMLGCGALSVVFLVFLYRSTSAEMAKLRDLHVKCAQQQEALAAQLQVIYEYKVQLEKTLSNEKSANAAVKEELQQKASRERNLGDKDSLEAMQRFNALQQNYKLLQTEHQDLKDDCKKKESVALENAKRLESTLQELRIQLKKAAGDKVKALEHLKNKFEAIVSVKEQLEEKYSSLKKLTGDHNGDVERLQKQVIQLQRELNDSKTPHFSVGGVKPEDSPLLPRHANEDNNNNNNNNVDKPPALENQMQVARPSSQQQAALLSSSNAAKPASALQGPLESSSKPSSALQSEGRAALNKPATMVKLPHGVVPIPRLIESKNEDEAPPPPPPEPKNNKQESAGQAPPPVEPEQPAKLPQAEESDPDKQQQPPQQQQLRHVGEQILDRHDAEVWYKMKPGVQEVGDPHHIEKNGFDNPGGNEDVEQYDDYNYKEPQNKNGDLHLEEGEDEREGAEDEDDYMHNNMNAVKHE